jgi:phage terminase small subunit
VKLTAKQDRFCREYIIDLNATQAAKRAGYVAPNTQGPRLLVNVGIQARIAELQADALKIVGVNAEYVLRQAQKLHERCMQEVSPVMVREGRESVPLYDDEGRQVFQFNAAGAAKALEIIGKHIDVQAFSEKHEHQHSGHIEHVQVTDDDKAMIRELRKRREDARVTH